MGLRPGETRQLLHVYSHKQAVVTNRMLFVFCHQDNTLRHKNTNLCIELGEDGEKILMKPCTGIQRQIWNWKRRDQSENDDEKNER